MTVFNHSIKLANGDEIALSDYRGKVLLLVNTASQCGFTYQYDGLEKLHKDYKEKGLQVIGFPCDQFGGQAPGSSAEEQEFCRLNHGVTFPITEKIEVLGENANLLFKYLQSVTEFTEFGFFREGVDLEVLLSEKFGINFDERHSVKWNFTKFLVDKEGNVTRFEPTTSTEEIEVVLQKVL